VNSFTRSRLVWIDHSLRCHYLIGGGSVDTSEEEAEREPEAPITFTHAETLSRMEDIAETVRRIAEKAERSDLDESYLQDLDHDFARLDAHRKKLEAEETRARLEHQIGRVARGRVTMPGEPGSGLRTQPGHDHDYDRDAILEPDSIEDHRFRDPWKLTEMRSFGQAPDAIGRELRSRALSAAEKMRGCSDSIRSAATKLLQDNDNDDGILSKQMLLTSAPAYYRAWSKIASNPVVGVADLDPEERRALNEVRAFQRAMSLSDPAGGYLVPFQLDPTVILTSDGSYNEIRGLSRQVVAIGDTWNGVSAGAVSWSFDAEASEVSDDAPTFAGPAISIFMARGFVPISLEARMDASNVTAEVGRLLAQGKDDLEAIKFATGTGTAEPWGLVSALVASAPTSIVTSTTADTFAFNDLYKVQGALPARYRSRAAWLANNLFWNLTRQTAPSTTVWQEPATDRQPRLLGRTVAEAEAMDGVINATQENYLAIFGDFTNYVIADRIGMTVDFIPHLFGTNRRPTGQSGWFAYYRVGADSVNDAAFRMYNVT
jgi:HK97 family phage major capsid protein